MKQALITTERAVLTKLGFHVAVEHPHKFILSYLRVLAADPVCDVLHRGTSCASALTGRSASMSMAMLPSLPHAGNRAWCRSARTPFV